MGSPEGLHVLISEYVENAVAKRAPYRVDHLERIAEAKAAGRIVMAGALGDPPHGAHIVFRDAAEAERFAAEDPYVLNGIVTGRRVEPWTVV